MSNIPRKRNYPKTRKPGSGRKKKEGYDKYHVSLEVARVDKLKISLSKYINDKLAQDFPDPPS